MCDNSDPSPASNPDQIEKAKKVELIIRSLGSIIWAWAWLWDQIENPAIERKRQRGIGNKENR